MTRSRPTIVVFASIIVIGVLTVLPFLKIRAGKNAGANPPVATTPRTFSLSKKAILTSGIWQVDELIHSIGGKTTFFKRAGKNNTGVKYELMDFTFNADGTGSTTQNNGSEVYEFQWKFVDSTERAIDLKIKNSITYRWHMVEITSDYLHATTPLNNFGDSGDLESFRLRRVSNSPNESFTDHQ